MENLTMKFMREVGRIKDPVIFLGLARTLGVNLYTEEKDGNSEKLKPKEFSVLFDEKLRWRRTQAQKGSYKDVARGQRR